MPRIRPPRQAEPDPADLPVMEDHTPPTEDIEIALADDPGGDAEIELAPTPEPEAPPPPAPPAPSADDALVRAAEATRRAEELQRANAELIRRDREREEQLAREQTGREDAEYNSVLTAIAAEQGSLTKAKADYAAAASAGDWEAAAEAQDAIAAARTQLVDLERGKQSFETRRAEPPPQRPAPAPAAAAPPPDFEQKVASLGVPDNAKSWLRQHPELVNDAAKNEELGAAHLYLTKAKKIEPFSQAYFEALDTEFGFKAAPAAAPQPEPQPQPQRRSMPMTAPVSRDVPTPSGQRQSSSKVTLTAEERQIARTSFTAPDMTNEQKELLYARNKQRLAQQRANGAYPQPERN
jgi:hypothetical protein